MSSSRAPWGGKSALSSSQVEELEKALRALDPPVIARIEDDRVLFDLRTVAPTDDQRLATLITSV